MRRVKAAAEHPTTFSNAGQVSKASPFSTEPEEYTSATQTPPPQASPRFQQDMCEISRHYMQGVLRQSSPAISR
jgi:hypothetical protein